MKLNVMKRTAGKKGEVNAMRREGNVPGVLYGAGIEVQVIGLKGSELQAAMRGVKTGTLATTLFELVVDGKTRKAIVKDIQYHPVTYAILHIDFLILDDKTPVQLNVPIQLVGQNDCAGVKLGGMLRQVIRALRVECLPKDIPQEFTLNVGALNIAESLRLSDIAIPKGVKPLARMNEVAAAVGKR